MNGGLAEEGQLVSSCDAAGGVGHSIFLFFFKSRVSKGKMSGISYGSSSIGFHSKL